MPSPFPFDFSLFFLLPFFLLSFCSSQSHYFPASYAVLFGDGAALLITRTYTPAYTHTSCLLTLKQKYGFYNTKKIYREVQWGCRLRKAVCAKGRDQRGLQRDGSPALHDRARQLGSLWYAVQLSWGHGCKERR